MRIEDQACLVGAADPGCLSINMEVLARPLGTLALSGNQIRVTTSMVPVLRCSACQLRVAGRLTPDGRQFVFPNPVNTGKVQPGVDNADYWRVQRNKLARELADVRDELETARQEHQQYVERNAEINREIAQMCHPVHAVVSWLVALEDSPQRRMVTLEEIIGRAKAALATEGE